MASAVLSTQKKYSDRKVAIGDRSYWQALKLCSHVRSSVETLGRLGLASAAASNKNHSFVEGMKPVTKVVTLVYLATVALRDL